MHPQLVEDVLDVASNRPGADYEPVCNLARFQTICKQPQDLELTVREPGMDLRVIHRSAEKRVDAGEQLVGRERFHEVVVLTEPRESFTAQLLNPVNATLESAGQKSTIYISSNTS